MGTAIDTIYLLGTADGMQQPLAVELLSLGLPVKLTEPAGSAFRAGDLVVHLHQLSDGDGQRRLQACAREGGGSYLPVAVSADHVQLGPFVRRGTAGCPACVRAFNRTTWSELSVARVDIGVLAALDWSDAFRKALCSLVRDDIALLTRAEEPATWRPFVRVLRSDFSEWSRHDVLVHPNCEQCSHLPPDEAAAVQPFAGEPPIVDHSYRGANSHLEGNGLASWFVGPRCGLIKKLVHDTASHLHPMTFAPFSLDDYPAKFEVGVGRTGGRTLDSKVAILEALERFAGMRPRGRRTAVYGSYTSLRDSALDPKSFILHEPGQVQEAGHRMLAYSDQFECHWVWGYSFRHQKPVLIPEQLAYYHLPRRPDGRSDRFVFEISNGCAVGGSAEEAIFYGLLETIERDAYLATWYGRIPARALDLALLGDPYVAALKARLEGDGMEVRVCDVGVGFSVPTVAAFAINRHPGASAALVCAAGAHPDLAKAIAGALVEVCTMAISRSPDAAKAGRERGMQLLVKPELVQTSDDHIDQCRPPAILERMSFMLGQDAVGSSLPRLQREPPARGLLDLRLALYALVDEVMTVAEDVVVVDQTFSGLHRHGLRCVKVLVPGLLPMTFGHQYRRISEFRLKQARHRCGLVPDLPDAAAWLPHTFP